jgi:hypothetical protein
LTREDGSHLSPLLLSPHGRLPARWSAAIKRESGLVARPYQLREELW